MRRKHDCPMCSPEEELQKDIAKYLRDNLSPDIFWTAIESSGRGLRDGARQKAKGVRKGPGDFLFLLREHVWIELKRPSCRVCKRQKGRQSEEQKTFEGAVIEAGGHYHIAHSLAEVLGILKAHGVINSTLFGGSHE